MKKLSFAFLGCVIFLCGCGKDLEYFARRVSEELQMPVIIKTNADDLCARNQFKKLFKEYKKMSTLQKEALKNQIKSKYKSIFILPTQNVDRIAIERAYLHLTSTECYYDYGGGWGPGYSHWQTHPVYGSRPANWSGWRSPYYADCAVVEVENKIIFNSRANETNALPINKWITENGSLCFQAESIKFTTVNRNFYTNLWNIYQPLNAVNTEEFDLYLLRGLIWQSYPQNYQSFECGTEVLLNHLMN